MRLKARKKPYKTSAIFSSNVSRRMTLDDYFRMGYVSHVNGDLRAAAEWYACSIDMSPSAEGHTYLAKVLCQLGELDAAIAECRTALKIDPEFGNAWNDLGAYMLEKRRFKDAAKFLDRASRSRNFDHREVSHFHLARCYLQKGMLVRAAQELREALDIKPDFHSAKEFLSRVESQIH